MTGYQDSSDIRNIRKAFVNLLESLGSIRFEEEKGKAFDVLPVISNIDRA
jgi:hypothetical protein